MELLVLESKCARNRFNFIHCPVRAPGYRRLPPKMAMVRASTCRNCRDGMWVVILGFASWTVATRMPRQNQALMISVIPPMRGTLPQSQLLDESADEVEEKKHPGGSWAPDFSDSDYESTERDL